MDRTPKVKVCVATGIIPKLEMVGRYQCVETAEEQSYTPCTPESRIMARGIPIGIEFHWQQEVDMSLPGIVVLRHTQDGKCDLFNLLDAETYLHSVISSEMNPLAPPEFLKAHAVISRSWLMNKLNHNTHHLHAGKIATPCKIVTWEDTDDHEGFDVCSDDHCQRYQGDARVNEVVKDAIEQTRGLVLHDHDGAVVDARFSKCCGGKTELFSTCWQDKDYNYLPGMEDKWCDLSRLAPSERDDLLTRSLMNYDLTTKHYHDWTQIVSASDIEARLKERHNIRCGRVRDMHVVDRGYSGRARLLRIDAELGSFYIGKELAIRRLLSADCLYSSWFDILRTQQGEETLFTLDGHGWGHGVGLCQIGAAAMAHAGKNYQEILSYYYPGTTLSKIY